MHAAAGSAGGSSKAERGPARSVVATDLANQVAASEASKISRVGRSRMKLGGLSTGSVKGFVKGSTGSSSRLLASGGTVHAAAGGATVATGAHQSTGSILQQGLSGDSTDDAKDDAGDDAWGAAWGDDDDIDLDDAADDDVDVRPVAVAAATTATTATVKTSTRPRLGTRGGPSTATSTATSTAPSTPLAPPLLLRRIGCR